MAKLVLSMDGLVLKEISLDKPRITIGRKANNDIQIDNLAISGQHAAIAVILDDAFLEDLNSTNGTYVNGQSVKKRVLQDNDVVEMGKYRLKYMLEGGEGGSVTGATGGLGAPLDTALDAPADQPAAGAAAKPAAAGEAVPASAPRLGVVRVLSGPNAGREVSLDKPRTSLGKPGHQVAVIVRKPDGYLITHIEGAVYPKVNGIELAAEGRRLGDHDSIEIAGVKMEFLLRS
ncbi:MAG: FHA domain-containing protein [Rhodocyclales bacterium]|nr:FHA domain-containing protein [Rhodocyclales bacterium]